MSMEEFIRKDRFKGSDKQFISVGTQHFGFNAEFTRASRLDNNKSVTIYPDPKDFKIGFKFHDNTRENSFKMSFQSGSSKGKKRNSLQCASSQIVKKHDWIKSVTELPNIMDRRFTPKLVEKLWVIQLKPTFEKNVKEVKDIPSGVVGIYRYKFKGEIVYIGRGDIRAEASKYKDNMKFDTIEYSIVERKKEQKKWEKHWTDLYKKEHGILPRYNKQGGG